MTHTRRKFFCVLCWQEFTNLVTGLYGQWDHRSENIPFHKNRVSSRIVLVFYFCICLSLYAFYEKMAMSNYTFYATGILYIHFFDSGLAFQYFSPTIGLWLAGTILKPLIGTFFGFINAMVVILSVAVPPSPGIGPFLFTIIFNLLNIPLDGLALAVTLAIFMNYPATAGHVMVTNIGMLHTEHLLFANPQRKPRMLIKSLYPYDQKPTHSILLLWVGLDINLLFFNAHCMPAPRLTSG